MTQNLNHALIAVSKDAAKLVQQYLAAEEVLPEGKACVRQSLDDDPRGISIVSGMSFLHPTTTLLFSLSLSNALACRFEELALSFNGGGKATASCY